MHLLFLIKIDENHALLKFYKTFIDIVLYEIFIHRFREICNKKFWFFFSIFSIQSEFAKIVHEISIEKN